MAKPLLLLTILPVLLFTGCGMLSNHLHGGLSEQEAQEMVIVLKENGLDASAEHEVGEKKEGGGTWAVKVRGGDQNLVLAWRVLRENGLPKEKSKGLGDVFAGGGMIPTAAEEKARLLVGIQGEIARTLKSVNGVADARVHIVLPENSPLIDRSQWSPTTASVLMRYQAAQPPLTEPEVKALVAKGVEGLLPEHVAVVFKKMEVRNQPPRDVGWYMSNQHFLLAALGLLAITTLGSLLLAVQGRQQRAKIVRLERQIQGR
jgi:type III secretion protein J